MIRYIKTFTVVAVLMLSALLPSCDEYNTDVMGTAFNPANSLVSQFIYPVYVEYGGGDVRVWGPNKDLVSTTSDGARLTVTTLSDSIALIVYGNAEGDTIKPLHGQLHVMADNDFAMYLNGLRLHSEQGPAIDVESDPDRTCYIVVGHKSDNVLTDSTDPGRGFGCIHVDGALYFDGTGTISVTSQSADAIYAAGGLVCNYALTANLTSLLADAIHTSGNEVRLLKGTWKVYPGRFPVNTEGAPAYLGEEAKLYINDSLFVIPEEPADSIN